MIAADRLHRAYQRVRDALLAERSAAGHWEGELSTSALSTATAVAALAMVQRQHPGSSTHSAMIARGLEWLASHQNADGGWGDTVRSFSNISTTMLCRAAFHICEATTEYPKTLERVEAHLAERFGRTPEALAESVRQRYGKDRTFSVPILTTCALAGLVSWREVPSLPFEAAVLPQSWYRFARLPVVSYALPALIAIGQCVYQHRPPWNPITRAVRAISRRRTLSVLQSIQPQSGGFLEAAPLTSFVTMSLASIGHADHPVARQGIAFLTSTVRADGSWPIDTNLAIWVTTLSINAFAATDDLDALSNRESLRDWLLAQQMQERHPYTGAEPGGWAWTDLSGGVPDCDDTPGAILALQNLGVTGTAIERGRRWMRDLQNRDGGFPTFCRGWGVLPFDRSGCDLTAHALRAFGTDIDPRVRDRGFRYLATQQENDGSWLPLWFGNQHAPDDINPVYGTSRVLAAYRDLHMTDAVECRRGVAFLLSIQNPDGGWGGAGQTPSSVEETALALDVLIDLASPGERESITRGFDWLIDAIENDRWREPTPIGFYFAKLWYFERLYPLVFSVTALGRAIRKGSGSVR